MKYREAKTQDIEEIQRIRNSVKENKLAQPGSISGDDISEYLFHRGKGWVCENQCNLLGFGIVDLKGKNVWALFVDPNHEKKGIGKQLHNLMLNWYFKQSNEIIWLGTSPNTRAQIFYQKCGWIQNGSNGEDEIKFEMTKNKWLS